MDRKQLTEWLFIQMAGYECTPTERSILGTGAEKTVFKAKSSKDGKDYAVYCMDNSGMRIIEEELFELLPDYIKKSMDFNSYFAKKDLTREQKAFKYLAAPNKMTKIVVSELKDQEKINFF